MNGLIARTMKSRELSGEFILTYLGPATDSGTINARLYAKSLLGFTNAVEKITSKVLHADVAITLKAEKDNCWSSYSDFILSPDIQVLKNTAEWLMIFAFAAEKINLLPMSIFNMLLDILKSAKGKSKAIKEVIQKLDLPLLQKDELYKLSKDSDIREAIDDMTEVLEAEGMNEIHVEQKGHLKNIITKLDRPAMVAQPEDETEEELSEREVSVVYLSPERDEWKFVDKSKEYWATVTDQAFLEKLKHKSVDEISGNKFTATLRTVSVKEAGTKRTKYERTIYGFKTQSKQALLIS